MSRAKAAVSPVVDKMVSSVRETHEKIVARPKPSSPVFYPRPSRVPYAAKKGNFDMLGKMRERTLEDIVDYKLPTHPRPERFPL